MFVGSANGSAAIDSSISTAIQNSNKISLIKIISLPEQNVKTTIVATKTEGIGKKNSSVMWAEYGYFKQQACDFHLNKKNIPENCIFLRKSRLSVLQIR